MVVAAAIETHKSPTLDFRMDWRRRLFGFRVGSRPERLRSI